MIHILFKNCLLKSYIKDTCGLYKIFEIYLLNSIKTSFNFYEIIFLLFKIYFLYFIVFNRQNKNNINNNNEFLVHEHKLVTVFLVYYIYPTEVLKFWHYIIYSNIDDIEMRQ